MIQQVYPVMNADQLQHYHNLWINVVQYQITKGHWGYLNKHTWTGYWCYAVSNKTFLNIVAGIRHGKWGME